MPEVFQIDSIPGKPVGNKTLVPNNWGDGLVGPFGNKTGQPLLPWRYKIDLVVNKAASAWKKELGDRCPIEILENFCERDSLKKGYGRWQSLEVVQVVDGEEDKWDIGTLHKSIIKYKRAPLKLNLHAVETTSLFVKKIAILLMDCAVERNTGFYFPYACRFPLDIILTTYGFKDGYTRTIRYHQCGIATDSSYELGYGLTDILKNKLSFICNKPEFVNIDDNYNDQWKYD